MKELFREKDFTRVGYFQSILEAEGIEVAWNQVELCGSNLDEQQRERLFSEIRWAMRAHASSPCGHAGA